MPAVRVVKAHAYGNDFVCVPAADAGEDGASLARAICHRHHGIGADGLLLYTPRERGASMKLRNADGSWSELSGNGLRCLAALVAQEPGPSATDDGHDRDRRGYEDARPAGARRRALHVSSGNGAASKSPSDDNRGSGGVRHRLGARSRQPAVCGARPVA